MIATKHCLQIIQQSQLPELDRYCARQLIIVHVPTSTHKTVKQTIHSQASQHRINILQETKQTQLSNHARHRARQTIIAQIAINA
jgi:hypothetical protein